MYHQVQLCHQPVSYTHLDVYKRQDMDSLHSTFLPILGSVLPSLPVSYTHLDVYKRQG